MVCHCVDEKEDEYEKTIERKRKVSGMSREQGDERKRDKKRRTVD